MSPCLRLFVVLAAVVMSFGSVLVTPAQASSTGAQATIHITGGGADISQLQIPVGTELAVPRNEESRAVSVQIGDNFFSPATLRVPVDTTVTWTNAGSKHDVTAAGAFGSGIIGRGWTFSFTFTAPGTYSYVCELHEGMSGIVQVTEAHDADSAQRAVPPARARGPQPGAATAAGAATELAAQPKSRQSVVAPPVGGSDTPPVIFFLVGITALATAAGLGTFGIWFARAG